MRHLHLERCTVDLETRTVRSPDGLVALSELEVRLLEYLAAQQGRAVGRDELLVEVWGMKRPAETRCVDTAIRRLRVKLEADPAHPRHLLKVHGVGYRLDARGPPPLEEPARPGTIEVPPGRFIGREDELAQLGRALRGEARRLWIMGPEGSGRRRLALEAALRHGGVFPGGVFVGRIEGMARSAPAGRALLVLPEQSPPADAPIVTLQVGRPEAPGEPLLRLGPLNAADATALLLDRAGPLPEAMAERLVAALDGLPLAIEEAAARIALLGPADVLARLDEEVMLPELHRRTRACIDALPPELRAAAVQLSVFQVPFRLDTACALVGGGALPLLLELVDRGLLLREGGPGPARLRMPKLLRRQLRALDPDPSETDRRHLSTLLQRGETLHASFRGLEGDAARAEVIAELEDFLAAHRTALSCDRVAAVRLLLVLDGPLRSLGQFGRAAELHDATEAAGELPPLWRSRLLQLRAEARRMTGRLDQARADAVRALEEAIRSGDAIEHGVARATLALVDHTAGALDEAEAGYREAVAKLAEAGEEHYQAIWLGNLGRLLAERGAHAEAEPLLRRVLELRLRTNHPLQVARARSNLGWLLMELGLTGEAERELRLSLEGFAGTSDRSLAMLGRLSLGRLLLDLGRPDEALVEFEHAGRLAEALSEPRTRAQSLNYRAVAYLLKGELARAERELRACVELHRTSEQPQLAGPALLWTAAVVAAQGRIREAEAALSQVEADEWPGLHVIASVSLDLARARQQRTEGAARLRARQALDRLEAQTSADAELRVARRWLESLLASRVSSGR